MPEQTDRKDPLAELGQMVERAETFERAALKIDEEARTVELSFSSEFPVERWWGKEILDHASAKAANLKRLNSAAPLLLCHDRNQQIGVVEKAWIDEGAKKGRALVRFSKSARAEEIWQDVLDGIRRTVSFRYAVQDMILEKSEKGAGDTYRATKWEPIEISLEPTPADYSVGVGRSLQPDPAQAKTPAATSSDAERVTTTAQPNTEVRTAMENQIETPTAPAVNPAVAQARAVVEMGEIFGETELARTMAAEGKTVDELRAAVLEKRKAAQAKTPAVDPHTAAERQGGGQQLARAVTSRVAGLRNFKGEGAAERALRFGQWFLAGPLGLKRAQDFCREHGIEVRAHSEGVNEKGGFLVPEEFGNDMIDLREQFGVFRRNAKIVPMASDVRSDPRRTGGLTAYFVGEGDSITVSDKGWDRVSLRAKKLAVLARVSSEVNEDAVINFGDDLAGEIAYAFANKEDECGFNGDGTSTYGGIVGVREKIKGLSGTIANIAGLHVGTGNAFSELTLADFEAVVALLPQYADTPRAKWFVHRSFYYNVMVKLMLASGGVTAAEIEGARVKRFLGYEVEFAQVLPKAEANSQVSALLGDMMLAASLGDRRTTTIALSEHSRFANDEIEIKGTERFDINVHDVGNASATAALRQAGPIVGLITAAA